MNHAKQKTDCIHGTIYLSSFESELSSTPFFYRLHDIYQSSTVYLTFPSNRTKRYEHSLGTMVLASELLFSAITNADSLVRTAFIEQLNDEFFELINKVLTNGFHSDYFGKSRSIFDHIVKNSKYGSAAENEKLAASTFNSKIDQGIKEVLASDLLSDDALNHFSLHSTQKENKGDKAKTGNRFMGYTVTVERERFIYQCILQAVRLVALFHDVGHPPFSHIIEQVLVELCKESSDVCCEESSDVYCKESKKSLDSWNLDKTQKLKNTIGRFLAQKNPTNFYFLNTEGPAANSQLHEKVGIQMFRMAVEYVFPNILERISEAELTAKAKCILSLYYITSVEFAASILLEKNNLFHSIHRIIDGTIDADRLDYVVRDSHASGVDWGSIPYKRLIDSVRLYQVTKDDIIDVSGKSDYFVIAYPQKVTPDIEDFLLTRYKIFARINYHHRCMRTAAALKSAVTILAKDYLSSPPGLSEPITEAGLTFLDDELCQPLSESDPDNPDWWKQDFPIIINKNIHNLWTALGTTSDDEALKVLQWNDSWMISTLQSSLLKIRTDECFKEKYLLQAARKYWRDMRNTPDWTISTDEKIVRIRTFLSKKEDELEDLLKNLEEFLLNKKAYYSLFKRGIDSKQFVDDVITYASLPIQDIKKQLEVEATKYFQGNPNHLPISRCLDDSYKGHATSTGSALEAIHRLSRFLKSVEIGDLKQITSIFPPDGEDVISIIDNTLRETVETGAITDFKIYPNDGRDKMGLPKHSGPTDEIYLYNDSLHHDDSRHLFKYDESVSLKPQLSAIEQSVLWLNVYVIPASDCRDITSLLNSLRLKCAESLGKQIRVRYNELFPHHE